MGTFFGMAAIVGVGYAGTFAVKATEPEAEKKEVVDTLQRLQFNQHNRKNIVLN